MSANAVSYSNVVQLSLLAVALGGYMALTIWAYSDIWIRGGRKTIYTNSHFFFIIGLILTAIWLTELTHFFLFLANQPSMLTSELYKRHIQAGLVAALGIHQSICNYFNINLGLADQKWIHMSMCLFVTIITITTSWQQLHRISPMSMLATKVVILYQLIMLGEAVVSLMVGLICLSSWGSSEYRCWTHVKTIEDLVLPLFPITYILMLRRRNLSQWVFKFLNDKGGAQRLPSETFDDNCQEMSDTISLAFPSTVFSVVSAEDDDEEESPDQYQ